MTTPIIRAMLVATVVLGYHSGTYGQTVVDSDSYQSDIQLKNIRATKDRIFVWEKSGVRIFDAGKLGPETHFTLTTSPSGRAFAVDYREGGIQIVELGLNDSQKIYQHKMADLSNCVLIANESGSRIWCILLSRATRKVLVLDTEKRQLVNELSVSDEFSDESNVYSASGQNLFVATLALQGSEVVYNVRKMNDSGSLGEPLMSFKNTVMLRLETCEDGSLIAGGRNELHQPSSGFVCNIDANSFKTRWTSRQLIPYCLTVSGKNLLIGEGDNELYVVNAQNGEQIGKCLVGDQSLVRLASSTTAVWGLAEDSHTIVRVDLSKILKIVRKD